MLSTKDLSKEEINELPLAQYEGKVQVITDQSSAIKAIKELKNENIIGFDTETRPSFNKGEFYPVCMIQLCSKSTAYVFRIHQFQIPDELLQLFEDKAIIKTGVAISDDLKGLKKIKPFKEQGFVELAELAKKQGYKKLGLRSLAASIMGVRISKSAKLTNWERADLNSAQINYAATDAWIGRELYKKLNQSGQNQSE
jgi:ribonuclease D